MFRRPFNSTLLFSNRIYGGPVGRNSSKLRTQPDRGLKQPHERGTDAFDPRHMRSRNAARQMASLKAIQEQKSRAARSEGMADLDTYGRARELSHFAEPESADEAAFLDSELEREMQLRPGKSDIDMRREQNKVRMPSGLNIPTGPEALVRPRQTHSGQAATGGNDNDVPYTALMHQARVREDTKRLYLKHKYAQTPTATEYSLALKKINSEAKDEEQVEQLQDRLVEESGLYPTQRLDAYMLRDESVFPQWVNDLPVYLRDRVRYGGIGLTEDDEVLRQNLNKMPMDERASEWARLKSAREYKQGTSEKRISPAEMRQLRLGIRRHHQLHHRRLARATLIKRLALRVPEKFEVWPTRDVDYSARLGQVAQFVEAGVPTMGEWPLDLRKLTNSRKKQMVAREAEKEFVRAGVALPHMGSQQQGLQDRIGQGVKDVLNRLEDKERDVKRISRRYFYQRFTAIKLGYQDEHGRKFHKMDAWSKRRRKTAYSSEDEMRMDKQALERPNLQGKRYVANSGYQAEYPYSEERRNTGLPSDNNMPIR